MKFSFSTKFLTVLLLQTAFDAQVMAQYAFVQPFGDTVSPAPPAWTVANGSASVVAGQTGATGNSLELAKGTGGDGTETTVVQPVTWNPAQQIAFIDLKVKPAANTAGSLASIFANGAQIAFQDGKIWVYHGTDDQPEGTAAQWTETVGSYTIAPGTTEATTFLHLTLREDYTHHVWDLYVDGQLVAANMGFEGREANLTDIEFYGSLAGKVHVDELGADPANMLFTDADKDGLPDSWESTHGGNPAVYDRDTIVGGKSLLQSYMESLWSAGSRLPNGKVAGSMSDGGGNSIPPLNILASHQPVGATQGSLSAGGDGSAVYSIPIDVPKGTAGMEPKLALSYSSSGGNGFCGVGWSLGGLQKITRGAASAVKDGYYHPVDFSQYDRFFLDGERLVCVAGTYGADQSEYRTEMDTFSRITLNGTGSAQWWKVETKAGLIMELGHTTDSVEVATGGVMSWGVNKVSDTVGNYYSVGYVRDTLSGIDVTDLRVDNIAYTGNAAAGVAPYCKVLFDYEARTDISRAYGPQLSHVVSKRLSKIRVVTDGTYTNHSYRLGYTVSYQSNRSFLTSIQKFARDNNSLSIPATTFTYDGLAAGASPWGTAPQNSQWPVYNATWDATSNVNSMVSLGDGGTSIRLDGDVARVTPLPLPNGKITVFSDTIMTFKVHAENFVSGAYIALESDTTYSASPSRLTLIKGSGAPSGGIARRDTINYVPGTDGWMSVSVPVGQVATGDHFFLALINADDNPNDGISNIVFKDVRIYRTSDTSVPAPLVFSGQWEVPHFSDNLGRDLGIRFIDLNSDGLPDMCDWRADNYNLTGTTLTPNTVGQIYRNTGNGFVLDNSLKPPAWLPISSRKDDLASYNYDKKHHLFAREMDINGDGKPDFLGSTDIRLNSGALSNALTFWTNLGSGWQELPEYKLPFRIKNIASSAPYGGTPRDQHYEWIDIDSDGYLDLVIYTTTQGKLVREDDDSTVIVPGDTTTCWLNKVYLHKGWIRADNLGLPEMLQRTFPSENSIGRKLIDITGDGHPEIMESLSQNVEQRNTYQMTFAANGQATGWTTGKDSGTAPASKLDLPKVPGSVNNAPFVNVSGGPLGGEMLDLNGDGLPDYVRKVVLNGVTSGCVYMNLGKGASTVWNLEPPAVDQTTSYDVPRPLYFNLSGSDYPTGYEFTDINGDGLPDLLVSQNNTGLNMHNVVLLNTGNGWDSRESWGLPGSNRIYNTYADSQNSKRRSKLQDLNGDGFPDLITGLVDQAPQVWINQCKPEVLLTVTDGFDCKQAVDGFDSRLEIEYRRLNDPTPLDGDAAGRPVYIANTSALPPGQIAVQDSRLVVSRLKEPDGQGGWRCTRHHYGDMRFDRLNDSSLGFGWTEVHSELWPLGGGKTEKGYNRTEMSLTYPNSGSPMNVSSYVNVLTDNGPVGTYLPGVTAGFKLTSETIATYGELPYYEGVGGRVRRPVQISSIDRKYDLNGLLTSQVTTAQTYENITLPAISWEWDEMLHKMVPSGTALSTWNNLNVYGFAGHTVVTSLDGTVVDTSNTYQHNVAAGKWFLGRLTNSSVVKTPPTGGGATSTKQSVFTYSATTGLLITETVQSASAPTVTKTNSYDGFGNTSGISVTDGSQVRGKTTAFDSRGRFPDSETDALGNVTSYSYDKQAALLSSSTTDGLTTSFDYDDFGTKLVTRKPDGTAAAEITRYASNADLPAQVLTALNPSGGAGGVTTIKWQRSAQSSGTPWDTAWYDALGRPVITEKTVMTAMSAAGNPSFNRQYTIVKYDNRGRRLRVTDPFLLGDGIYWSSFNYDPVDRVMETIYPDGTIDGIKTLEAVTLNGQPHLHSIIHNRKGNLIERWDDQHGRLVRSSDPSGQTTVFSNDVEGHVTQVSVAGVSILTNSYDGLGRKTDVADADSGATHLHYNGFGEVVWTQNARAQISTKTYDVLGRIVTATEPEGTWTHYYNTSGPANCQIDHITGPNSYLEQVSYDSLGRQIQVARTQFGETLVTSNTFNALGEAKTSTDAGGVTTTTIYDPVYGIFKIREDLTSASTGPIGVAVWKFGSVTQSADQFSTTETLPGSIQRTTVTNAKTGRTAAIQTTRDGSPGKIQNLTYIWDDNGNLTSRTDNVIGKSETFEYDSLDRLTKSTIAGQTAVSYGYDAKGNLLTKGADTLTYGGARPHAVSSATIKGASRSYTYDADGNATADGKRAFGWTSFGQLASVTQTSCPLLKSFDATTAYTNPSNFSPIINGIPAAVQFSTSTASAVFDFDASGARSRQSITRTFADGSTADITRTYVGDYEREIDGTTPSGGIRSTTKTISRHKLGAGSTYIVDNTVGAPGGAVARLSTILTDPLGSTDVVLVSEYSAGAWSMTKAERQSFNAWGERRNASDWSAQRTASTDAYQTSGASYRQGYTGHEMLDDFGLVHMNGRIYDAELGRFLSPDPYVQLPEWSQNFNRYSYVLNNPLSHTDPTGHKISGLLSVIVLVIVAVVAVYAAAAIVAGGAVSLTAPTAGFTAGELTASATIAGGISGAANCAIQGGSGGDIVKAGLMGAASGAITNGILGPLEHGGGWTGVASEQAASKASLATVALHIAGHGLLGGATNAAMGGKFQDGFLSGVAGAAAGHLGLYEMIGEGMDPGSFAARTALAGVVGGTASVVGGGKFANGASTAAFQYAVGSTIKYVQENFDDLLGKNYQQKTNSCLVASTRNMLEALGKKVPSEEQLRAEFDSVRGSPRDWSKQGASMPEAVKVLKMHGVEAAAEDISLKSLLKQKDPAILGMRNADGSGHAILLEKSSYKSFLFFKMDRSYSITNPAQTDPKSSSPPLQTKSYAEMRGNFDGYNGGYDGKAIIIKK